MTTAQLWGLIVSPHSISTAPSPSLFSHTVAVLWFFSLGLVIYADKLQTLPNLEANIRHTIKNITQLMLNKVINILSRHVHQCAQGGGELYIFRNATAMCKLSNKAQFTFISEIVILFQNERCFVMAFLK